MRNGMRISILGILTVAFLITNLSAAEIHEAVKKGDAANVQALIAGNPALANDRDEYSLTPLHYAAMLDLKEIAELLLAKGAGIDLRTADGQSAYNLALESGHPAWAEWLAGKRAKRDPQEFPVLKGPYFGQKPPGPKPEIFAPGVFSTVFRDSPPEFSADGREVYWSRKPFRQGNSGGLNWLGGMVIMFSRLEDGGWTAPQSLPFTTAEANGYNPRLSLDGRRLFFCSNTRPPAAEPRENFSGTNVPTGDLWVSQREGQGWSNPAPLPPPVNSVGDDDCATLAKDGTLYFLRWRPDAGGTNATYGIYRARLVQGALESPEPLPSPINTKYGEYPTYIAPDQSYLIFVSMRPEGRGSLDLYVTFRLKDGSWSAPVSMGNGINSPGVDTHGRVTPDGKYFFFTSNRGGLWFVYWTEAAIIEKLKRQALN